MPKLSPLLSREKIEARVAEMGREILADYDEQPLHVVAVLKGSFIFLADLVRTMDTQVHVHFLGVSSYQGSRSTGEVQITHDLDKPLAGEHVLLVEDIVDTGLTLRYLLDNLRARQPASLKVASLLDKPSRRKVEVKADYVGFEIPDEFVVGYGLDYNECYRNVDHIAIYSD